MTLIDEWHFLQMINWVKYIEETFKGVDELGKAEHITVIVRDISYFKQFGHILQNAIKKEKNTICNITNNSTIMILISRMKWYTEQT